MTRPAHEYAALAALAEAVREHAPAAFSCSFGLEDMVILDLIARHDLRAEVFTIDTGRLHEETHALMARARARYGREIRVLFPQAEALERLVRRDGPNGFYSSLEARHACCAVRKVEPLGRALAGKRLWITGLRRGQAVTRAEVPVLAADPVHDLFKLNPLAEWTEKQVLAYLREYDVPVNALHARGYPSIGCAPCTRAVEPGEDPRAGRWWWEQPEHKECGLHVGPDGRLARTNPRSSRQPA
ncbi:MAG: phosphoadenylyl-sulfate reductase [Burkholderiales bacterium]|nr:phosphoadenylyl-sulfate reductase [Burkholderiales bacterium]OJX09142.1 MAG: phosphoadenosine phosphosulfate reductase [Burkholderiales bacterium 70-64]